MTDCAAALSDLSPPRHTLVWLDAERWQQHLLHDLPPAQLQAAQEWFQCGYPAIARRRQTADGPAGIVLGIPLPPGRDIEGGPRGDKTRIALCVRPTAVRTQQPPPRLDSVLPSTPPAWRAPLTRLVADTDALGVCLRVYGSLLWQHLTAQPHTTQHSDVDLLFRAHNAQQLHAVLVLLQTWEHDSGVRADGELLLRDGRAVAWRELLRAPEKILVKSADTVALMAHADLLPLLSGEPA